ncbi:MAG: dienelactone hydrolase family protein [Balneolaceae bacterium]
MKVNIHILFSLVILIMIIPHVNLYSQHGDEKDVKARDLWERIAPYFSPPAEYKNEYGAYPSPLTFYDGKSVQNRDDWERRRQEILDKWHEIMGEWPPLLKNPKFEIIDTSRRDNFVQHRIRFNWVPDQTTDGYLLIPDDHGQKPAVVTVYYEPETAVGLSESANRDFAYQLARRGFVTLSIGTSEATEAETYSIYYPDIHNAEVEPLSILAYAAANAWYLLADWPEVDSERIGIVGHSFGGKWAMFASALFENYAAAVWSDPGIVFDNSASNINYWEPWYLGYHPPPWRERGLITEDNPARGAYPKLLDEGHDLTELHALMAPRRFLVSGGSVDPESRWVPLNHTIAVNRLLGMENRVAMTNRPEHSPNAESNEQIYWFFEYFLKYEGR